MQRNNIGDLTSTCSFLRELKDLFPANERTANSARFADSAARIYDRSQQVAAYELREMTLQRVSETNCFMSAMHCTHGAVSLGSGFILIACETRMAAKPNSHSMYIDLSPVLLELMPI